jgi:adenylate cyclase
MYGELLPQGGGDPIPLRKEHLWVGRREKCDIVLRFPNVSSEHCELILNQGYWYVKDNNSSNGVKVNGTRVTEKRIDPGDMLSVAKHDYKVNYSPVDNGAIGPPPPDKMEENILGKSLLERAGLEKRQFAQSIKAGERDVEKRIDLEDDTPDQLKKHRKNDPV